MDILSEQGIKVQSIRGIDYVYKDKPYWDKDKKQNRHKREYIGKLDKDGAFIPNKNYKHNQSKPEKSVIDTGDLSIAERKYCGATILLDFIGNDSGLTDDLNTAFGVSAAQKILSLAYFLTLENESSMYRFEKFAKTHDHPHEKVIASQRISEIFASISEAEKVAFFRLRALRCLKEEHLVYDTTSISSYSEMMDIVRYGKNKDLEDLPQINLALAIGEKSLTPAYYRKLPGNISDVSTVEKLLIDMDYIGIKNSKFVLDRGFFSKDNINALFRKKHKFVIAVRANTNLYKNFIDEIRESIKGFLNYNDELGIYSASKKSTWGYEYTDQSGNKAVSNKQIFLLGYYDGTRAENEKTDFLKKLRIAKAAVLTNDASTAQINFVKSFFTTEQQDDGQIIVGEHDQTAINSHMAAFGYFMLLSNHMENPEEALKLYRNKDVVEKVFCNLKQRLDMKRCKVSSEDSLEGKLFVQFVALSFITRIHLVMSQNGLYKNYTISSLLDELDVIEIYRYKNRKPHFSEITKKQFDIYAAFGADIMSTL